MAVRNSLMNAGNPIFNAFSMEQVSPGERATLSAAMSVLWQVGWVVGGIWYASLQATLGFDAGYTVASSRSSRSTRPRPCCTGSGSAPPTAGCWCSDRRPESGADSRADMPGRNGCVGGDGGESNSPSRTLRRRPLRACPMVCRRPPGRASALCRAVQSRAPRSGLTPDYVTLVRIAASLSDASTTREAEVASTLTLLPKQRGRESTGGCQVLRFAA